AEHDAALRQRIAEFLAAAFEPNFDRTRWDAEPHGNLVARELFQVEEHQRLAIGWRQAVELLVHDRQKLAAADPVDRLHELRYRGFALADGAPLGGEPRVA